MMCNLNPVLVIEPRDQLLRTHSWRKADHPGIHTGIVRWRRRLAER